MSEAIGAPSNTPTQSLFLNRSPVIDIGLPAVPLVSERRGQNSKIQADLAFGGAAPKRPASGCPRSR